MSILKVARMGHPVLRTPARPLERTEIASTRVQTLIDDMIDTMREYGGVGLAAPQVHEGLRLFVALLDERDHGDRDGEPDAEDGRDGPAPVVLLNPEIVVVDSQIVVDWEGCLSIPDIRGRVPRVRELVVRALDRQGQPIELRKASFPARVIQHETDHLDGILFVDRMRDFSSLAFTEEYARHWKTD